MFNIVVKFNWKKKESIFIRAENQEFYILL